jgi:hypothetical protein
VRFRPQLLMSRACTHSITRDDWVGRSVDGQSSRVRGRCTNTDRDEGVSRKTVLTHVLDDGSGIPRWLS